MAKFFNSRLYATTFYLQREITFVAIMLLLGTQQVISEPLNHPLHSNNTNHNDAIDTELTNCIQ